MNKIVNETCQLFLLCPTTGTKCFASFVLSGPADLPTDNRVQAFPPNLFATSERNRHQLNWKSIFFKVQRSPPIFLRPEMKMFSISIVLVNTRVRTVRVDTMEEAEATAN